MLIGFLIADRYDYSPEVTAAVAGGSLMAAGVGMVVAQAVIVPRSGWPPSRLMLVGTAVGAVAIAAHIPDFGMPVLVVAVMLSALGIGMAMPGFTAGPTLAVEPHEKGAVTGLVTATMGLTFVLAPVLGGTLYDLQPSVPLIVAVVWMMATCALVYLHPTFSPRRSRGAATARR